MDREAATLTLEKYFKPFSIIKVEDSNLKHTKHYFTDEKSEKYLFYYSYFEDFNMLMQYWQAIQDEDIAFYLQGHKFARKDIRWDTYFILLYKNDKGIKEDIYVNIERNRFCCKKLILCAESEATLINDLRSKLPFTTSDYYPESDLCLISNEEFFNELREIALLDERVFTNDLLENISENSSKWINLLSNEE
jgi:hypothetical protein